MFDESTLNQDALRKLPAYQCPRTYHIDRNLGSGCSGDPPGFPTYFLRSVYTQHGDTPHGGPTHVLRDASGVFRAIPETDWRGTREESDARRDALMRRLWLPLPYGHPRVRAWIVAAYQQMKHCYRDGAPGPHLKPPEYGRPATLIFPVPYYELRTFHDDERFSEEWRAKEQAAVAEHNAQLCTLYAKRCVPEYHAAYLTVSGYYPEHGPDLALIADPGRVRPGDWWETEDIQPLPQACTAGVVTLPSGGHLYRGCSGPPNGWTHPTGKTWCQWCGWTEPEPPRDTRTALERFPGEAMPRTCHDCLPGESC